MSEKTFRLLKADLISEGTAGSNLYGMNSDAVKHSAISNVVETNRNHEIHWHELLSHINGWMVRRSLHNEHYFRSAEIDYESTTSACTFAMMMQGAFLPHVDTNNPEQDIDSLFLQYQWKELFTNVRLGFAFHI